VGIYELCHWMEGKGAEGTAPMNKGGSLVVSGIRVTMVHADHSCGILDDGKIVYGGEAVGYVIEFENGYRVYHAGDTNLFGDMRLIGELYRPDLVILPVGDRFTMGPREAACACRLLDARLVIPMHFGTFPLLTGTPDGLREEVRGIDGLEILALKPGESLG
jgi:L-ascorbate metabolism protein UlaG (beta-lactamase superfamily)